MQTAIGTLQTQIRAIDTSKLQKALNPAGMVYFNFSYTTQKNSYQAPSNGVWKIVGGTGYTVNGVSVACNGATIPCNTGHRIELTKAGTISAFFIPEVA